MYHFRKTCHICLLNIDSNDFTYGSILLKEPHSVVLSFESGKFRFT